MITTGSKGVQIPIRGMVAVELERNNVQFMKRYEELVNEYYKEPVNEMFDDVTTSALKALVSDESTVFEGC